ncbi:MAG TPA: hypothetical protein VF796_08420, partial [Humisphaera sp.]
MSQVPNDGIRPAGTDATTPPPAPAKAEREGIPEGLWLRCPECGDMLFRTVVEDALHVCPGCQHHF